MDFNLFDRVRINDENVIGTIVDIYNGDNGQSIYVVQSDNADFRNRKNVYPGEHPLFDCTENQLIRI